MQSHEAIYTLDEPASGLRAVIAIHDTRLGPAMGGTRYHSYVARQDAIDDALRLSEAMTYKCALAGVDAGGGKAVLMAEPNTPKSPALLAAYAQLLNRLGDRFCTGGDIGFGTDDCDAVRRMTPFIAGTTTHGRGDPGRDTAAGVFNAIRVVAEMFLERDLVGLRVSVQGLGAVGATLTRLLHSSGARLTISDLDPLRARILASETGAKIVEPSEILGVDADVFAPCGIGGVVNMETVDKICARAIVGAANNQLTDTALAGVLHDRGILWAPDFLVNAGGVIGAEEEVARSRGHSFNSTSRGQTDERLALIGNRLAEVVRRAERNSTTPYAEAMAMAQARLDSAERHKAPSPPLREEQIHLAS